MDTPVREPNNSSTRLCSKCSVLEFDDSKFGTEEHKGYESVQEGESMLAFDNDFPEQDTNRIYGCPLGATLDYEHHDLLPELDGLRRSAETGCDFCHSLREAIQKSDVWMQAKKVAIRLRYYWRSEKTYSIQYGLNALVAHLYMHTDESEEGNVLEEILCVDEEGQIRQNTAYVVFKAESGIGNCQSWLQLEPAPRSDILCAEQVGTLRSLLDTCSHQCNHLKHAQIKPTRLLDLNASNTKDGICLIDTKSSNLPEELEYAALSYCWGSKEDAAKQFTTTTHSLRERLADIHLNSLSGVMKDAVVVTRSLKIRYLWIDSVCIIQDDRQDWERESKMMGYIYSNAFVTIGAQVSSSCLQGFLDRPDSLSIKFHSTVKPTIEGSFRLRYHSVVKCLMLFDSWGFDQRYNPWKTRAWTLQEEMLSTRLILFGKSRVIFKCTNRVSVEPFEKPLLDLKPERDLEHDLGDQAAASILDIWTSSISVHYSTRQMTAIDDVFPALSGLAERVAMTAGDVYIAGLWKNHLPRGLEWVWVRPREMSVEDHLAELNAPQTYLCPSWSWAAVRGYFEIARKAYWYDDFRSECEIVSAWSELASELNPFGRINDAGLQIRGRVAELPSSLYLVFERSFRPQEWKVNMGGHFRATCRLDWRSPLDIEPLQGKVLMLLLSSYGGYYYDPKEYLNDSDSHSEPSKSDAARFDTSKDEYDLKHADMTQKGRGDGHDDETLVYKKEAQGDGRSEDISAECIQSGIDGSSEDEENRVAVGILLYPAKREGKYFRVGSFFCEIPHGGLQVFLGHEYRHVDII